MSHVVVLGLVFPTLDPYDRVGGMDWYGTYPDDTGLLAASLRPGRFGWCFKPKGFVDLGMTVLVLGKGSGPSRPVHAPSI
jgi:hypothetical protein